MADFIEHKFCLLLDEFPRYQEAFVPMRIEDLERHGYYLHIVSLDNSIVKEPHNTVQRLRSRRTCLPMPLERVPTSLILCVLLIIIAPVKLFHATCRMLKLLFQTPWPLAVFSNFLQACQLVNQVIVHEEITAFYGILQHDCMRTAIIATEFSPLPIIAEVRAQHLYSMNEKVLLRYLSKVKIVLAETDDELLYLKHVTAGMSDPPLMFQCGHGIDPQDYPFIFPDSEYDVTPPYRILSIGELHKRKGFDTSLQALKILRAQGLDCHLTIVGDGFEKGRLKRLCKKLHLTEYVEFTGGLPRQKLLNLLQDAHVLLQPGRVPKNKCHDSMPFSLLEAMGAGVPVAASALPGVIDLAEHGETALLFQPDDPDAAAEACKQILTDYGLRDMLIMKARLIVEGKYNRRRRSAELVDILEAAGIES